MYTAMTGTNVLVSLIMFRSNADYSCTYAVTYMVTEHTLGMGRFVGVRPRAGFLVEGVPPSLLSIK